MQQHGLEIRVLARCIDDFEPALRTSSPRLGRGLMPSFLTHSVWLPFILCDASVNMPSFWISFNDPTHFPSSYPYWTMSGRIGDLNTAGSG